MIDAEETSRQIRFIFAHSSAQVNGVWPQPTAFVSCIDSHSQNLWHMRPLFVWVRKNPMFCPNSNYLSCLNSDIFPMISCDFAVLRAQQRADPLTSASIVASHGKSWSWSRGLLYPHYFNKYLDTDWVLRHWFFQRRGGSSGLVNA